MFTAQNSPWSTATRYSVYQPVLAVPKGFQCNFNVYYGQIWRFGCGLAHLNREQNDSLSFIILETRTAKLVIRFEVRSFLSCCYFLRYGHLAIPAKLHGPKGDRINESLLYNRGRGWKQCRHIICSCRHVFCVTLSCECNIIFCMHNYNGWQRFDDADWKNFLNKICMSACIQRIPVVERCYSNASVHGCSIVSSSLWWFVAVTSYEKY